MKTANEMYQYCLKNNFGTGFNEKWALKHLKIIEQALQIDEDVMLCFLGLHNYHSSTQHSGNFAYAITNKRFLFAHKGILGQSLQSISFNMINDVSYSSNFGTDYFGIITFNTIKTCFNVACGREQGMRILSEIQRLLDEIKFLNKNIFTPADEIMKYKKLFDAGAITQEEFEMKKKQLLNQ